MDLKQKQLFNRLKSIPVKMMIEDGCDYCSASPDVIQGVRISRACKKHDAAYKLLIDWRANHSIHYFQFVYYRFQADHQLRKDIITLGQLQGVDLTLEANTYQYACHWLNPFFRLFCRLTGKE